MSRKYTDGIPEGVAIGTLGALGILVSGCHAISTAAKFLEKEPEFAKAVSVLSGFLAVVSIIIGIVDSYYHPLGIRGVAALLLFAGIWIMPFVSFISFAAYKADQDKRSGKPERPFWGEKAEVWEARMAAQRQRDESRPQI